MATKKPDPDTLKGVLRGLRAGIGGETGAFRHGGVDGQSFFSAGVTATEDTAIGKDSRLEAAGNCPRQREMAQNKERE